MVIDTIRFSENSNIILACHITSVYDVNRNTTLEDDNYELVQAWATSITERNLQGIIFHNNFSQETCDTYTNDSISFVKIAYNPRFNPNVYRYFVYKAFLQQHLHLFKHIFITDVSDVTVVKNPFVDAFYLDNPTSIFCGDEPKKLNDSWMQAHSSQLREKISDFAAYESQFADDKLLNCGIIGGNFAELGNPYIKNEYHFLKSYSPLHNIKQQAYPAILVTNGYNDSRQYFDRIG